MTIEAVCGKLAGRSAMAVLLMTLPLAAQNYVGTSTSVSPAPTSTSPLVMHLTMGGTAISGAVGIGTAAATIPVSGTRNGQNCSVVAGGITYTGVCTATRFSGWYKSGAQQGTFSVAAAAVAAPAVAAQVAMPPVRAVAPVAAGPAQQRALNPVGGGAPAPPAVAANGVVGWLAAPPQAQPPPPVVVPWLASTGTPAQGATPTPAKVPVTPQPAPVPARPAVIAPPVPVRPAIPPTAAAMCGAGQQYQGTFYADSEESIFFNLTLGGATIGGTTGITGPGTTFLNIYPVTGTRVGTTCMVKTRGGAVFAGTCDAQSFRGNYNSANGVMPFVTMCGGTYPPAPAPAPPTPPVPPGPVTCPKSSPTPEMYQGIMTTAQGVQDPIAFNLVTEGGTIAGTMGIGVVGRPLDTPNRITGTRMGQNCSVTGPLGAVYTGICNGKTFSGTYNSPDGTMHFTTSLAAGLDDSTTMCGAGPTPVPVPVPVKCPAAGAMQLYRGTIQVTDETDVMLLDLAFNGGNITGTMGIGQAGTTPPLNAPLTGTMAGGHCHMVMGGMDTGAVLDGTCDGHTFTGAFTNGMLGMGFTVTNTTAGATAGCVAPVPIPIPGPVPVPTPVPPVAQVVRYCGMFQNNTENFGGAIEFDLQTAGSWVKAQMRIGQPVTANVPRDYGTGGVSSGTWAVAGCAAVFDSGFEMTWGKCSATEITGNYIIPGGNGQENGSFDATLTTATSCPKMQ